MKMEKYTSKKEKKNCFTFIKLKFKVIEKRVDELDDRMKCSFV